MGLHFIPDFEHRGHGCDFRMGMCRQMTRFTSGNFEHWQLVDSIEPVRNITGITQEWFGLVVLPIVSFSADGAVAAGYFCQKTFHRYWFGKELEDDPRDALAKAEAIDLSIQFVLLWMPALILIGWWTNKPFSLLFGAFLMSMTLLILCAEQSGRFL